MDLYVYEQWIQNNFGVDVANSCVTDRSQYMYVYNSIIHLGDAVVFFLSFLDDMVFVSLIVL